MDNNSMSIKINKFAILIGVAIVVALIYLLGRYGYHRELRGAENALNQARDSIRQYTVVIAGKEQQVTELAQVIATKDIAIEQGLIEKEKYKKLYYRSIQSNTNLTAQVTMLIDSIAAIKPQIIYITPNADESTIMDDNMIFDTEAGEQTDTFPCVRIPYDWVYVDKWVKAVGHVDDKAETTLKIDMPLDLSVVIGKKKKSGIETVSVLESNPYVTITNINSVGIRDKKWYDSFWVHYGLGILTASGIVFLVK